MTNDNQDEAAAEALARAIRKGWPARGIEKGATGWSRLVLVALRTDPDGLAAVVAALLDGERLARALATPGLLEHPVEDAEGLARDILAALGGSSERDV
jgi:hypothetical protein